MGTAQKTIWSKKKKKWPVHSSCVVSRWLRWRGRRYSTISRDPTVRKRKGGVMLMTSEGRQYSITPPFPSLFLPPSLPPSLHTYHNNCPWWTQKREWTVSLLSRVPTTHLRYGSAWFEWRDEVLGPLPIFVSLHQIIPSIRKFHHRTLFTVMVDKWITGRGTIFGRSTPLMETLYEQTDWKWL